MEGVAWLRVDTGRWPLVVLTHSGRPSDGQLAEHLREIEEKVLARGERFVQIIDQSGGEMPDARQRALIAEHQQKMDQVYRRYCFGEVYVVAQQNRGAMVAVFWLAKPSYPYAFVETLSEALMWAKARLTPAS